MKGKMFLSIAMMAVLTLSSCNGNSPTDTAEKAAKCMQDGNYDGLADLVYIEEKEGEDIESQRKMISGLIGSLSSKTIDKKQGIRSYEVTGEEISEDGETATVRMDITYGDGSEKKDDVTSLRKDKDGKWKLCLGK